MMAACMEQKRLGLANKTIMVVPKPLIGQTASEFLRLYPSANILVATERDFEKSRRKQFVSRIATGDYDCIIMSHSQFEKIPISAERKERMLNEQIDEISYAIDEMKERNGERWTVKQMESQKKKLEEQLKSLSDESRKDDLITFEELGVDSIMVDEAHNFKNLAIFSNMNNVSGISSSGAKKSTDMQLKCQYLSEINDGRGIVFATGTPISNTMCEMYVMQLYLQKAALEEMGIYHFDSWAANFGEVTTALELTVEGSGFRFKSRFNKFTNLPELMNIFREVADVQTADMLDLDVPALRGGKPIIVESEPDWYVKQVMEDFVVRAERIRDGGVDPREDNFLKITHEARLLGTDARLIDKDAPNNPDGKLNKVAENVWKEYEKGNANGHIGCQLIFSDIGTPGPDKDFTIYDYLKETLIQYGIPADEIAFIHDAKTDAQRDALFKEMRTGKKKVLIGSTDKCGTGVNVQTHLVAMHHVDCPWKPSSIEQREGRGIRQGNENEEVAIYRYVTKGTFDAYNWSLVENKQRFISQVMTSKAVSRSCEDIDEATLSYAEIKAVATGNPLIKEKMEIDNDVQRLKLLKASYDNQRYGLQDNFMIKYPKLIKTATEKLANVREDVKARDKELIDNPEFAITIGKATYTERVDGGTMMLEEISKCKTGETTAIGKFHGFELLVEKNFLDINYMVLRGKTEYKAELSTSPVGSMVKLENLFNGLHENIDFLEKKIEQYQNDLEASKTEYDKPFAYSKELEEKLLSAADRRKSLEYKLFQQLRGALAEARPRILFMADMLAQLDYWQSLAETAVRHNWSRPVLHTGQSITIREGRHPVVEGIIGEAAFVPNDLHMDEDRRLLLITGPNMAGKSTVLRQTALICLLAQMGSFVPAREAQLGLCDRIFSRVGASDNLAQGQSTFMVEMMETARILRQATKRSLVILDEIGRGTSTFDGLALAWAVAEELARRAGGSIRTLFATHYHELTALEGKIPGVHTMNIAIREWNGEIVFLRRLIPGPSDRSYGIEVARLAGVPQPVVQRAREILAQLEQNKGSSPVRQVMPNLLPGIQLPEAKPKKAVEEVAVAEPEHPLLVALRDTNPDALTPLEALKRITEWKLLWGAPKQ